MLMAPKERIDDGKLFGMWNDKDHSLCIKTVMAVINTIDAVPRDILNALSSLYRASKFDQAYTIARGYLDFVNKQLTPGEIGELLANEEYEENPIGIVFRKNVKFYNYKEEEVEIEYKKLQTLLSKKFNPQELNDYIGVYNILKIFEYGKALPGTTLNSLQITPSKPYPKNPQSLPLDAVLGDCGRDGEPKLVSNPKAVCENLLKTGQFGLVNIPSKEECQALEANLRDWGVGSSSSSSSETFTVDEDIMKMLSNFLEDAPPFEHFSAGDSKMEMQLRNNVIISCLVRNPLYIAFMTAENQIHRILLLKNLISYLNIAIAGLVAVDLPKSLITSKGSKNSGAIKSVLKEPFHYRTAGEDRNGLKDAVYPKCIVNLTSVQGKSCKQKCSHTFCTMMKQLMVNLRPAQATVFLSDERSEKNLLNLYKKLCSPSYCSSILNNKVRKERKSDIFDLLTKPPSNFKDFGGRVELPTESFHDKVLRLVKIKDCCGQEPPQQQQAHGAGYRDDDVPDFHKLFLPIQSDAIGPLETADATIGEPIKATATELRKCTIQKAKEAITLQDILKDVGITFEYTDAITSSPTSPILHQQQWHQQQLSNPTKQVYRNDYQDEELQSVLEEYMDSFQPEYQETQRQQQLSKKRKQNNNSFLQSKVAKLQHHSLSNNEDDAESLNASTYEANTSQHTSLLPKVDVTTTNPSLGSYPISPSIASATDDELTPLPTITTTSRTRTSSSKAVPFHHRQQPQQQPIQATTTTTTTTTNTTTTTTTNNTNNNSLLMQQQHSQSPSSQLQDTYLHSPTTISFQPIDFDTDSIAAFDFLKAIGTSTNSTPVLQQEY